ncbi:MAG: hypothetical protein GIX02_04460, partial [Candidatus Eremiobacteraeota bacterium]|nr:hypothetical protein [Candidatus Eremiobacteraeota bacterium]
MADTKTLPHVSAQPGAGTDTLFAVSMQNGIDGLDAGDPCAARVAVPKATQLAPDNMEAVFCLGQIDVVEG